MNIIMESRSRDTIAARAAILKDRNTIADRGTAWKNSNTLAAKAEILKNRDIGSKASSGNPYMRQPEQMNKHHTGRQMGADAPAVDSVGRRTGAYPGGLNLTVTPPAENRQARMETGLQSKGKLPSNHGEYGMVSQEQLQEAVIWSEILGAPLSKRRKRR